MVPLRTQLRHGDQVEIITSGPGAPSPAWETFVVTGKARARIRRFVCSKQRTEYVRLGEAILRKTFAEGGFNAPEPVLEGVLEDFQANTLEDLFAAVGEGLYTGSDVMRAVVPGPDGAKRQDRKGKRGKIAPRKPAAEGSNGAAENPIPIRGLIPGMAVHYANCCHPLPGDRIIGIMTAGKGVTIHTLECETLESFHETPERWVDVAWDLGPDADQDHVGRLLMVVANERGSLANLSSVVASNLGNINNLKITNRSKDFFEMSIDIEVKDAKHLNDIMAALRAVSAVSSVERGWD